MNSKHACKYLESLQQLLKQDGDKICHTGIVSVCIVTEPPQLCCSFNLKICFVQYILIKFQPPPTPPNPSQLHAH